MVDLCSKCSLKVHLKFVVVSCRELSVFSATHVSKLDVVYEKVHSNIDMTVVVVAKYTHTAYLCLFCFVYITLELN